MNKVLERQLKKIFGGLDKVPSGFEELLKLVSSTYDSAEEDRMLIERSMEISSRELGELNDRLKSESAVLQAKLQELARAEKSEKSSQEILDNMQEGCQIISPDWRCLYVNNALVVQSKQTKESLLSHTVMELYPDFEKTENYAAIKRCLETGQPQQLENEFTFPDGSKAWFSIKIEPVPRGVFMISTDITARKREEAELKKQSNEMERMNKLMIDREMKMIELKKEIAALKGEASK
jgi:PAS domain S-box-containing protein